MLGSAVLGVSAVACRRRQWSGTGRPPGPGDTNGFAVTGVEQPDRREPLWRVL